MLKIVLCNNTEAYEMIKISSLSLSYFCCNQFVNNLRKAFYVSQIIERNFNLPVLGVAIHEMFIERNSNLPVLGVAFHKMFIERNSHLPVLGVAFHKMFIEILTHLL